MTFHLSWFFSPALAHLAIINIIFLNKGHLCWNGNKDEVYDSDNEVLNDFVFANDLFKKVKKYVSLTNDK